MVGNVLIRVGRDGGKCAHPCGSGWWEMRSTLQVGMVTGCRGALRVRKVCRAGKVVVERISHHSHCIVHNAMRVVRNVKQDAAHNHVGGDSSHMMRLTIMWVATPATRCGSQSCGWRLQPQDAAHNHVGGDSSHTGVRSKQHFNLI